MLDEFATTGKSFARPRLHESRSKIRQIRRIELLARLTELEHKISEQATRAKFIRQKGWNAESADERLKLLVDSHELYLSALSHLLGKHFETQ